jgi:transposase
MKNKHVFIGIDVSKSTLDVFVHGIKHHFVIENGPAGFVTFLETIYKQLNLKKAEILVCFENTGKYSKMFSVFLQTEGIDFVMEPALKIKKSLGMTRGKNDKVDFGRIANYALEKKEKLNPTILSGEKLDKMKSLLALREKLIKHRTAYKNGITDLHDCYHEGETKLIKEIQERLIENLNHEIFKIEEELDSIIASDKSMSTNFGLVLSVIGIGKINAWFLIAYTANFSLFKNARAFACYCGIAPFENSSGTIKGKTKVHHFANKQIKKLINMAAISSISIKGEMMQYFNRRVYELGKNKMSTINIIRNKIIHRVFAVVKRGTPYVNLFRFAA